MRLGVALGWFGETLGIVWRQLASLGCNLVTLGLVLLLKIRFLNYLLWILTSKLDLHRPNLLSEF